MKKYLLIGIFLLAGTSAVVFSSAESSIRTNDLLVANIEALTQDTESGGESEWAGWIDGSTMSPVTVTSSFTIGTGVGLDGPNFGVTVTYSTIYCCLGASSRDRCNGNAQDINCGNHRTR